MTVSGDVEGMLVRKHTLTWEEAKAILHDIFKMVEDPNFAYRYLKEIEADDSEHTLKLHEYWEVVRFFQELFK